MKIQFIPKDQWDWQQGCWLRVPSWVHAVGASFDDSIDIEHDIQPFCENPYYVW